uniref:uncharacterized protein n=1 Tax=Pristiophorus japonicus TaxID=55135 RepID=UPI00398F6BA5
MEGGPPMQEPLTEIEIRALSLAGDSNHATTGIGADPPTQDDSEDSDQTSAERPDDRPTVSTSGVTQPSPDFTPARDEEEEEQHILEPVEVGLESEEEITVPSGPAGTSSTTDSIFSGFLHASLDSVQCTARGPQRCSAFAAATEVGAEKVRCCKTDRRVPGLGASITGQRRHKSRAAQGHGYDSRKHRGVIRTVGGYVASDHCDGANRQLRRCYVAIDGIGIWGGIPTPTPRSTAF